MLILKLGGAAITHKNNPNTANMMAIEQIAKILAQHPQPLVLVHGAGSFGHILANEYQLQQGYQSEAQKQGLIQLPLDLLDLNRIILGALHKVGLPAMTFHPASFCLMSHGRITRLFLEPLRHALSLNLIPVVYGDCVWDEEKTFGILSGDQLVVRFANELQAERVAFGTNVDGVLDAEGQVIPHYQYQTEHQISGSSGVDVTGGMHGKLAEIRQLKHAQAHIFNLNNREHLRSILSNETNVGTIIQPE